MKHQQISTKCKQNTYKDYKGRKYHFGLKSVSLFLLKTKHKVKVQRSISRAMATWMAIDMVALFIESFIYVLINVKRPFFLKYHC